MRYALQNQAKEATLMRTSISVKATSSSRLEKWQGNKTTVYDLYDELAKAHHSVSLLQYKLKHKEKDI